MRASDALAMLDRQIDAAPETVTLARGSTTATCQAIVQGGETAATDGPIGQERHALVLSPARLEAAGWPEPRIETATDQILIQGRYRTVVDVSTKAIGDVVVRINVTTIG
jgi:hypothetical protein